MRMLLYLIMAVCQYALNHQKRIKQRGGTVSLLLQIASRMKKSICNFLKKVIYYETESQSEGCKSKLSFVAGDQGRILVLRDSRANKIVWASSSRMFSPPCPKKYLSRRNCAILNFRPVLRHFFDSNSYLMLSNVAQYVFSEVRKWAK